MPRTQEKPSTPTPYAPARFTREECPVKSPTFYTVDLSKDPDAIRAYLQGIKEELRNTADRQRIRFLIHNILGHWGLHDSQLVMSPNTYGAYSSLRGGPDSVGCVLKNQQTGKAFLFNFSRELRHPWVERKPRAEWEFIQPTLFSKNVQALTNVLTLLPHADRKRTQIVVLPNIIGFGVIGPGLQSKPFFLTEDESRVWVNYPN